MPALDFLTGISPWWWVALALALGARIGACAWGIGNGDIFIVLNMACFGGFDRCSLAGRNADIIARTTVVSLCHWLDCVDDNRPQPLPTLWRW